MVNRKVDKTTNKYTQKLRIEQQQPHLKLG